VTRIVSLGRSAARFSIRIAVEYAVGNVASSASLSTLCTAWALLAGTVTSSAKPPSRSLPR
jgi:hypothetical protein